MRIPNVPERVKEVPAQALRAVFAGIGQALLVSDRVRRRLKEQGGGAEHRPPVAKAPVTGPDSAEQAMKARAPGATVSRPAAKAPSASAAPAPAPAAKPAPAKPAAGPAATKPAAAKPAAKPAAAKPTPAKPAAKPAAGAAATKPAAAKPAAKPAAAKPAPAAAEKHPDGQAQPAPAAQAPEAAPIENYDGLSFASLRARLRGLDQGQVRKLLAYERAHAARPDVMSMYERRIEKLGETG
jgi:hypothetical protein